MCSHSASDTDFFNLEITDYTLTPLCCASLINEIITNLLYQKDQIPYPYPWLKSVVQKKRHKDTENTSVSKPNLTISKHFRTVSTAYDSIETILRSISEELQCAERVEEVILVFGTTPISPKEVVTIRISSMARGHSERNHLVENNKKQLRVMRDLFLSPNWSCLGGNLSCTNCYVYVKKSGRTIEVNEDNVFVASKPLSVQPKVRQTVININYKDYFESSCCDKIRVFGDSNDSNQAIDNTVEIKSVHDDADVTWSQSKIKVQGFKDCFINKVSASELW